MGDTPEQIDRKERARAQFLAIQAKRNANSVRVSKVDSATYARSKGTRYANMNVSRYRLIQSPSSLGDIVRRQLVANANKLLNQKPAVVHVKNGKALTPEGEALLKPVEASK